MPPSVGKLVSLIRSRGIKLEDVAGFLHGVDTSILHSWYTMDVKPTSPLCTASSMGRSDILSLLLDRGADINFVGGTQGTALAAAAYGGMHETVLLLLDRGADIDMVGGKHGTALAAAAYKGNKKIVSLLLDRGADIDRASNPWGTALSVAGHSHHTARMDVVSVLLDRGADINKYALATAACVGNHEIVSLLLDRGADINRVHGPYGTALAAATWWGKKKVIELL